MAYLDKELSLGRIVGPLPSDGIHVNRIVVPKGHIPGKWHLITDLSLPPGESVNDGVDPKWCSMSYVTVDRVGSLGVEHCSPR